MTVSITNYYNLRTSNFKANDVADAIDAVQGVNFGGTTGGTSTAYTSTPTPAWTSYAAKDWIVIVPHTTNTGATTLNVSSLGTKNVYHCGRACVGGELASGVPAWLYYDGTQFQIANHGGGWATWSVDGTSFPTTPESMTFGTLTVNEARYRHAHGVGQFYCSVQGTTGGSTGNRIRLNLPFTFSSQDSIQAMVTLSYGSGPLGGFATPISTSVIDLRRYDAGAAFTVPTTVTLIVHGFGRLI